MAAPLNAPMPPDLVVGGSWRLVFAAVNPSTGAAVSGVTVSNVVIDADYITPDPDPDTIKPLPPLYVSLPDEPNVLAGG